MEAESQKKELAPSLDSLTLGPEHVLLFSPHQEAVPSSYLPCLQCPGMPSAGNGPGSPHAVQGTEGDCICLLNPSTVPAESTLSLMCICQSQLFSGSRAAADGSRGLGTPASPLVFTIGKRTLVSLPLGPRITVVFQGQVQIPRLLSVPTSEVPWHCGKSWAGMELLSSHSEGQS